RGASRRHRRPRRALRRALHDRPRPADGRNGAGGRARGGASPLRLARAVEPGGRLRPPRPSRRRILVRRVLAVVAVLLVLGAVGAAFAIRSSSNAAPPPTTTIRQLRQFRIVFPEGFTRAKMADRVGVVAKIAK